MKVPEWNRENSSLIMPPAVLLRRLVERCINRDVTWCPQQQGGRNSNKKTSHPSNKCMRHASFFFKHFLSERKNKWIHALWEGTKPSNIPPAYLPICWSLSSCCCAWTWQADPRTARADSPAAIETNDARSKVEISAYSVRKPLATFPQRRTEPYPINLLH